MAAPPLSVALPLCEAAESGFASAETVATTLADHAMQMRCVCTSTAAATCTQICALKGSDFSAQVRIRSGCAACTSPAVSGWLGDLPAALCSRDAPALPAELRPLQGGKPHSRTLRAAEL